ncbi:MAG: 50S ribosomal protein L21 [Arcobacter sp.]|nr:50S ribosomal protein L21 [Arcobacter sp.]
MYAIIKTGGKQYKVSQGDILNVDKLSLDPKETVKFTEVIAINDGTALKVGADVANSIVTGVVKFEIKDKKRKKVSVYAA